MLRSVYTNYEIQSELSSAFFRKAHPGHTVVATVWQELDAAWDAWRKRTAEEAVIEAANAAPEDKARAEAWAAWTRKWIKSS